MSADNQKHKDLGRYIPNSKKELYTSGNLNVDNFNELSDEEKLHKVDKKSVWKNIDYSQLKNLPDGLQRAAFLKNIKDALPKEPLDLSTLRINGLNFTNDSKINQQISNLIYIWSINKIRNIAEKCLNPEFNILNSVNKKIDLSDFYLNLMNDEEFTIKRRFKDGSGFYYKDTTLFNLNSISENMLLDFTKKNNIEFSLVSGSQIVFNKNDNKDNLKNILKRSFPEYSDEFENITNDKWNFYISSQLGDFIFKTLQNFYSFNFKIGKTLSNQKWNWNNLIKSKDVKNENIDNDDIFDAILNSKLTFSKKSTSSIQFDSVFKVNHLDVIRDGYNFTHQKHIHGELLMEDFKIDGIEWGNYVKTKKVSSVNEEDERGTYIELYYNSFADLAKAINIDTKYIGLTNEKTNISLAIGTGSRGKGNAAATYNYANKQLHLTRNKGAMGVVAHEWFHAYDNYLFEKMENAGLISSHVFDKVVTGKLHKMFSSAYEYCKKNKLYEEVEKFVKFDKNFASLMDEIKDFKKDSIVYDGSKKDKENIDLIKGIYGNSDLKNNILLNNWIEQLIFHANDTLKSSVKFLSYLDKIDTIPPSYTNTLLKKHLSIFASDELRKEIDEVPNLLDYLNNKENKKNIFDNIKTNLSIFVNNVDNKMIDDFKVLFMEELGNYYSNFKNHSVYKDMVSILKDGSEKVFSEFKNGDDFNISVNNGNLRQYADVVLLSVLKEKNYKDEMSDNVNNFFKEIIQKNSDTTDKKIFLSLCDYVVTGFHDLNRKFLINNLMGELIDYTFDKKIPMSYMEIGSLYYNEALSLDKLKSGNVNKKYYADDTEMIARLGEVFISKVQDGVNTFLCNPVCIDNNPLLKALNLSLYPKEVEFEKFSNLISASLKYHFPEPFNLDVSNLPYIHNQYGDKNKKQLDSLNYEMKNNKEYKPLNEKDVIQPSLFDDLFAEPEKTEKRTMKIK